MARIRTVKPEFWTHAIFGRLPDCAKWIAVALLNHADDEGFFRADPAVIRGSIAPFVEDLASIRRALDECSRAGWIEIIEHPLEGFIGRVVNFSKHQKIDRPSQSRIKGYWRFDEPSTNPRRTLDDGSLPEGNREQGTGKGNREQGREPKIELSNSVPDPGALASHAQPGLEALLVEAGLHDIGGGAEVRKAINGALRRGVAPSAIQEALAASPGLPVWAALARFDPARETPKRVVDDKGPWRFHG